MRESKYLIKITDVSGLLYIRVFRTLDGVEEYSVTIRGWPGPIYTLNQEMVDRIKHAVSTYRCNIIKSDCDAAMNLVKTIVFGG